MIKIENLNYHYRGSKHEVFSGLNLNIGQNHICGLLGKNGTGKSTLLYLLTGLLHPVSGRIEIDGHDARKRQPELLQELYIVPEEYDMPDIRVEDYLKINAPFYPRFSREVFDESMKGFEVPATQSLKAMSMGQKKKVLISFALATGTRYLLMDEPTNGLDIPSKSQFRQVVSRHMSDERTIIISTHQVHDVEQLIDQVVILSEQGLVLSATMEEICSRYSFEHRRIDELGDDVVYAEPSMAGYNVMAKRSGADSTTIDLELLFNAVVSGRVQNQFGESK